jgi:hypothetical protein
MIDRENKNMIKDWNRHRRMGGMLFREVEEGEYMIQVNAKVDEQVSADLVFVRHGPLASGTTVSNPGEAATQRVAMERTPGLEQRPWRGRMGYSLPLPVRSQSPEAGEVEIVGSSSSKPGPWVEPLRGATEPPDVGFLHLSGLFQRPIRSIEPEDHREGSIQNIAPRFLFRPPSRQSNLSP